MQKISGVLFEDGGEIFEQAAVNGNLFNSPSQTGAARIVFSVVLSCIRNVFCREIMSISGFINKFLVGSVIEVSLRLFRKIFRKFIADVDTTIVGQAPDVALGATTGSFADGIPLCLIGIDVRVAL